MANRRIRVSFIAVAAVLSIIVVLSGCAKNTEKPKGRPPVLVITAQASQQNVPVLIKAIGNMEASESVSVRSQLGGEIIKVAFREGQDVQKGALLFQLDPRTSQAALAKAEAALARDRSIMNNARKDYERYAQLVRDGIVTQEQAEGYRTKAESAAADVESDKAALDSARTQLSYCTITAPISGRLGALVVDRGNVVKSNDTVLVTINKITPINASFMVPEKDLTAIKRQMATGRVNVVAEVAGTPGVKETGVVTFIDNAIDPATGTIKIKASFVNAGRLLWPGQFASLSITMAVLNNAVVVPSQAVLTGQKGPYVFVVSKDGTAEIRPVGVGPVFQGVTVIEKGILPGEQVIVDGQMRVVPGGKVEVKPTDKVSGASSVSPQQAGTALK